MPHTAVLMQAECTVAIHVFFACSNATWRSTMVAGSSLFGFPGRSVGVQAMLRIEGFWLVEMDLWLKVKGDLDRVQHTLKTGRTGKGLIWHWFL